MLTYVARRVLYSVPVLFVSTFLSFVFVSYAGDPTSNLRQNPQFSAITLAHLRHRYHLDEPVVVRYWYWLQDVFTHRLGSSLVTSQPIWPDIQRTLAHTGQVVLFAEIFALTLGIAAGMYSAVRQYSPFDYFFTTLSFTGLAMPVFWLALLLQILFVDIYLKWHVRIFYTSGLNSTGSATWSMDRLQHIALPAMTICLVNFALYSRFMRAAMLDVISSDYVRTARAKGVVTGAGDRAPRRSQCPDPADDGRRAQPRRALRRRDRDGNGVQSRRNRLLLLPEAGQFDVYAVMGYLVVTSTIIIVFNLIADVLYGFLDPRIRYT